MKKIFLLALFICLPFLSSAAVSWSQSVTLSSGWNIVSTPRTLESHTFSVAETSDNFDIYALNPSSVSGWSTLAELGQTEFTPLYGYFINNKTGSNQTLTFNYKASTTISERLFERTFSTTGWHSFGVANPSYVKVRGSTAADANNPSNVLSALTTSSVNYDSVIDFTNASFSSSPDSVSLSEPWKLTVSADVNTLNDFRETKGYGIYIKQTPALYTGFQNDDIVRGALSISQSSSPAAQTVVASTTQFEFARYIFDASESSESVNVSQFSLSQTLSGDVEGSNLFCGLYYGDVLVAGPGSTDLPTNSTTEWTFAFAGGVLRVSAGEIKIISLKCDISRNTSGAVAFGLEDTNAVAAGITTGVNINPTITASSGPIMTIIPGVGSYTVGADSSEAYNYRVVRAGTEVSLAAFRFTASAHEDINVRQVALQLGNIASSSRTDLQGQMVTLWDGATQVGTAQFTTSNFATSTLTGNLIVPKGGVKTLVIKGSLTAQDSISGTPGALLAIHYDGDNNGLDGNYSTGISSNSRIDGVSADVSTYGVRIFANVPTVTVSTTGGSGLESDKDIYVFSVQNPGSRDIALKKVSFGIATSGGAVASDFTLYGDGVMANATPAQAPLGLLEIEFDNTSTAKVVPAGSSKSYTLRAGNVSNPDDVVDQLTVALLADSAYPSLVPPSLMGTYAEVTGSNFVWSPMSTTTLQANDATFEGFRDWTNGYGLPGFPGLGQSFPSVSWQSAN